ncbi:C4-dicarboxylate ABC transporter [Lentibacillus sp. CBA3610]|uniref:C4-dicarboxylate ABC transporter n=1 Tax=Lentibacillus sp. CBA3610 TaxID=2518176 RepID=UPI0015955898|nr:C4-dicarboxylate ABC transporter [Lentibacillus sp. CBA3610]QKY70221.1 C4-dicarboxylate ABC transporter [Lentibacillus sp. CBA3610]
MFQGILIIVVFLIVAGLMIARKLPTMLAMPILAIAIALIAGVPFFDVGEDGTDTGILSGIIEAGTVSLASAYIAVAFGAWLGRIMIDTGITNRTIKMAAELGGDRPLVVTVLLTVAIAILFTTVGGLGAVIMVGSIVLPILFSIGVPGITAVSLFLFAMGTGLSLNIANWNFYMSVLSVSQDTLQSFALIMVGLAGTFTLIFLLVEYKRHGFGTAWPQSNGEFGGEEEEKKVSMIALITPLIPIAMVIGFSWPIIPSFIVAILFSLIVTQKSVRKFVNTLTKTAYDGISDVAPVIMLMIGIGMLLESVSHPMVGEIMSPLLEAVIPTNIAGYIAFFALLAPLALYRGPLNMWGLGSGIASIIISLNLLSPTAVMGALFSTERMQAIADPTNTHNVWLANYAGVDVNQVLRKIILYVWVLCAVGVTIAAFLYF